MFFRVTIAFALVLGVGFTLAVVYGQKQVREPRVVRGTVAHYVAEVDNLREKRELLKSIRVPTHMEKNGGIKKLEKEQQENYQIIVAVGGEKFARVAACESDLRQKKGGVVVTNTSSYATGLFQILPAAHAERVRVLGINPENDVHNIVYAKLLAERRPGLEDWNASRYCWDDPKYLKFHFS
jgi:hypothetical protein